MSDDYLNFISAKNSTLLQKFTSSIQNYSNFHLRPFWFLSIVNSINLNEMLGFEKSNFIFFRIENLIYFYILTLLISYLLFKVTGNYIYSIILLLFCLMYPNNLNDICWTVGKVDILCAIFMFAALYVTYSFCEKNSDLKIAICLLFFLLALLTKESSVILPFISIIIIYISFGREKLHEIKYLIFLEFFLLILYFAYRIIILGTQPVEVVTAYQNPGIIYSVGVIFKASVSMLIPFDYLSIQDNLDLLNRNFLIYLIVSFSFLVTLLFIFSTTKSIGKLFLICLVFLSSILPNLIAGYFRPQLILIPFVLIAFTTALVLFKLKYYYKFFLITILALLINWGIIGYKLVKNWDYSYDVAEKVYAEFMNLDLDATKKNVILGLPSRLRQSYIMDYAIGPYNYYRHNEFEVKDKFFDLVYIGALDSGSLNSELFVKKISDNEFEIYTTGETQYFMRLDAYSNKYKDRDLILKMTEENIFNKPTVMYLRILTENVNIILYSEGKFRKLN
ncbi:MAG TPA: hypothetical protein PLD63_09355 [Ignavibacteria bacterium]|nr:hypothetical protein [Ignavibacteria bacterium]